MSHTRWDSKHLREEGPVLPPDFVGKVIPFPTRESLELSPIEAAYEEMLWANLALQQAKARYERAFKRHQELTKGGSRG